MLNEYWERVNAIFFFFFFQADDRRHLPVHVRALRDVVYHLVEGGRVAEAAQLLLDPIFLELRCRAGQVHDLLGDLDRLLGSAGGRTGVIRGAASALPATQRGALEAVRTALAANLHVVLAQPVLLLQQLANSTAVAEPLRVRVCTNHRAPSE